MTLETGWHEVTTRATGTVRVYLHQEFEDFIGERWTVMWPIEREMDGRRAGVKIVSTVEALHDQNVWEYMGHGAKEEAERRGARIMNVPVGLTLSQWFRYAEVAV